MIQKILAHAGEHHETAAEAAQHAANSNGITLSTSMLFWIALVVVPILIIAISQLLKFQLSTKLLVISSFLVVFSVVSYQHPGPYSIIALSVGFTIVLIQSMVGIGAKQ